jgi:hypothetical protein
LFRQLTHVPASAKQQKFAHSFKNFLKTLFYLTTSYSAALTFPGVIITQVPVFISEIAPKDIRGGLATSNQVTEIGAEVPLLF